ncbi:MAG TPA: AI-2E family transporter [Polyangiaceae bacterium]|nr:AI-2E family transporter [Polyangiaceae bacterium]
MASTLRLPSFSSSEPDRSLPDSQKLEIKPAPQDPKVAPAIPPEALDAVDDAPLSEAPQRRGARQRAATRGTRWMVAVVSVGAVLSLIPLWEPLLLAAFAAIVAEPLYAKLSRKLNGRSRAAGVVTLLLVVAVLSPTVVASLSIYKGAIELVTRLRQSADGSDALKQLVSGQPGIQHIDLSGAGLMKYLREHGGGALTAAQTVFGAATTVVVALFVFAIGFHSFLVDGRRAYAWVLKRSPIPRTHVVRLGNAFTETARGLLVGVGLTAIIQGAVATIGYIALGVPQALVLGLLTTMAALIPSVGTGLVWVPVGAGLFLAGRTQAAVILGCIGIVVSVVDNLLRPWLSRYGKLDLSGFVVLVSMLGGVAMFGGFGILLGPLLVRLATESWQLLHDEQLDAPLARRAAP